MKNSRKTARLELRISQAEKERITRKAQRCGLSATEYVLQCCSKTVPQEKPPDELWKLLDELYTVCGTLPSERRSELEQLVLNLQKAV